MLDKLKNSLREAKEKRLERKSKPWRKKQKIIFLSVFGALLLYVIISVIASGNADADFHLPELNLSVNSIDVILIIMVLIALAIIKLKNHFKNRKGR